MAPPACHTADHLAAARSGDRAAWGALLDHHRPYLTLLAAVQVAIGAVLAYLALPRAAQVAHLTVASLLLGSEMVVALLAHRLPDGPEARAPLTAPLPA